MVVFSQVTQARAVEAISLSSKYLEEWFPRLTDPFEICLCAYAFEIAQSNFRTAAFVRMREIRREGKGHYLYLIYMHAS